MVESSDVKHLEKTISDLEKFLIEKIEHLRSEVRDEKDSAKLARELAISALDKHLAALNNATEKEKLAKESFADKEVFDVQTRNTDKRLTDLETANKVAGAIVQTKASQAALIISYIVTAISLVFSVLNYLAK